MMTKHEFLRGWGYPSKTIDTPPTRHGKGRTAKTRTHTRTYVTAVIMLLILAILAILASLVVTPIIANAATTDAYQLYDTRERDQQVTVNKVWDDGLANDKRKNGSTDYTDLLDMTIQTSVPQASIRTYTITYDLNASGNSFGFEVTDIPRVTIAYNAKNRPVDAPDEFEVTPPERADGYAFVGWSTDKNATEPDPNITLTNTLTDSWMNSRADGSNTTLYAVWKDLRINYAVMAYGIGIDKDANGSTRGITFGPALGYPEFSPYNNSRDADASSTQTFTKSHSVNMDTTVMSENAPACKDASHSVITGTDAGTDAAGNAYRCLHYDNWTTIVYWSAHDPHVYDKCIPKHCSKTVVIAPNAGTIENGIFTTSMNDWQRGLVGDGQSYIVNSKWDNSGDGVDITQDGQGYAASLVRAKLVGADSHTKLDDKYAGVDALRRYRSESSILSCFPIVLRGDWRKHSSRHIVAKALSGVSAASSGDGMSYDTASNGDVSDQLWLFSYGEMTSAVYPSAGFSNSTDSDAKRSNNGTWWWLRSPSNSNGAYSLRRDGRLFSSCHVGFNDYAVAPGFIVGVLPS